MKNECMNNNICSGVNIDIKRIKKIKVIQTKIYNLTCQRISSKEMFCQIV